MMDAVGINKNGYKPNMIDVESVSYTHLLVDFIALTASLRERFLWGGSMGVCHTEYGIGVKFIIN